MFTAQTPAISFNFNMAQFDRDQLQVQMTETLKMAQAYGHEGGVSRYHKPKNYTRALGYIISDMDGLKPPKTPSL